MYKVEAVDYWTIDEEAFNDFPDKPIYTTTFWLDLLISEKNVKPVILNVYEDDRLLGHFTGAVIIKLGLKVFGSPLSGWFSAYMGFDFYESDRHSKPEALKAVLTYVFSELGCVYAEITDRDLIKPPVGPYHARVQVRNAFLTDLGQSDSEILSSFKSSARSKINKFNKLGCTVVRDDSDGFIDDYFRQMSDVFSRQGLKVPYSKDFVRGLVRRLSQADRIYCIKALSPENECIASLIQIGHGKTCYTFGAASYRRYQQPYSPNEALMYDALIHYKAMGYREFDYGGGGAYKKKFGGVPVAYHRMIFARYRGLFLLRDGLVKLYWVLNKARYALRK